MPPRARPRHIQPISLVLLGAGPVARALVRRLLAAAPAHADRDRVVFQIVAWADSDGAILEQDGLSRSNLEAAAAVKVAGMAFKDSPLGYEQGDPAAIVDIAGTEDCVVIDLTSSSGTVQALELSLERGYGVVTANKLPLTGEQAMFDRLVGSGRFRYESTVGSAVPLIEALRGLMRAADRIDTIRGALSGTLGYLFTGLQAGQAFSALVTEAVRLGLTEPDPRTDLSGVDVARKALILARTAGWRLEMSDVAVGSLILPEYAALPKDEFMARLPELDAAFGARVEEAAQAGCVLRYVAELAGGKVSAGMQSVPADSPLGRIRGNDNLVEYYTSIYPHDPLVLQGHGVAVEAAAAGVHADILALVECS